MVGWIDCTVSKHDFSRSVVHPNTTVRWRNAGLECSNLPLSWVNRSGNCWIWVHEYADIWRMLGNHNCLGHLGANRITDAPFCWIFLRTQIKREMGRIIVLRNHVLMYISGPNHLTRNSPFWSCSGGVCLGISCSLDMKRDPKMGITTAERGSFLPKHIITIRGLWRSTC